MLRQGTTLQGCIRWHSRTLAASICWPMKVGGICQARPTKSDPDHFRRAQANFTPGLVIVIFLFPTNLRRGCCRKVLSSFNTSLAIHSHHHLLTASLVSRSHCGSLCPLRIRSKVFKAQAGANKCLLKGQSNQLPLSHAFATSEPGTGIGRPQPISHLPITVDATHNSLEVDNITK